MAQHTVVPAGTANSTAAFEALETEGIDLV